MVYKALEEKIGVGNATTLMEHLPPVGWADVATKRDLEMLELRMDSGLDGIRTEMYQGFQRLTVTFVTWMLGLQAATIGVLLTAIKVWG